MRRLAVLPIPVAVFLGCGGEKAAPVQLGSPAPPYAAVTLNGDTVSLASLRGDVVLLNVWATWCHPCRDEIPALQRLHERHAASGLRVVGVSVDTRGETDRIRAFAAEFGATYAIWLDPDERVTSTFFAVGVPTTFLVGRDGTLLWRHTGPVRDDDPALGRALAQALAAQPSASAGDEAAGLPVARGRGRHYIGAGEKGFGPV